MLVNGREGLGMGMENKHGQMGLNMWGNGEKIGLMGRVDSSTLMGTYTMDFGQTTRQMGWAHTST